MKILKKINKGLILTILVLAIIIIYFINLEKQRESDKSDIQKACENFLEITDKYSVLPEELQTFQTEISEEQVKKYVNQMKEELSKVMINNQENIEIQRRVLESNLKNGYNEEQIRTKTSRKIQKIKNYQFDGNQVTVNLSNKIEETIKTSNGIIENNKVSEFTSTQDQIILQKIKGEWKIVYSNLKFDDSTRDYYYDNMLETTIVN